MSRENVDFVRRGYDALNEMLRRGKVDLRTIDEQWTSDCVIKPSGLLPESAEMHGHAGIAQFISNQMEAFDELQVETLEFLDAGESVVVPIRFGGKARYTGLEVTFDVVHVAAIRDGKVARLEMFLDKAEALAAAGLPD
jgi:ketosteroid isomerase-like protein